MKRIAQRAVMIIGGIILVIGGIVLLVLPGPGVVLIAAGIFLISPYHGRKIWARLKEWKHHHIDPQMEAWKNKQSQGNDNPPQKKP